MISWTKLFSDSTCRYMDQSKPTADDHPFTSFATDDALAISVGNELSPPTVRLWVHKSSVILGIPDARLPYVSDAMNWLSGQGFRAIVRNSGGLAVLLDEGVLNISFILPDVKKISIHDGYETMVAFIKDLFSDITDQIQAFEVVGSYCPGDYDLSIDGKKFAGISQRRVKNGMAVQIYLCIEGDGMKRAQLIREFYHIGLKGEKGKFVYPTIEPVTMASLNQLLPISFSVKDVVNRIETKLYEEFPSINTHALAGQELEWYQERLRQMEERNSKALD